MPDLDQAEVEHLDEVVVEPHAADVDVGRLDVPVHEPARMRVGERVAHLPEQEDGPVRRHGSELAHERLQVAPGQQLHHVVERPIVGQPEVEDLDGVRRAERGRGPGLALEAAHDQRGFRLADPEHFALHQLDRGVAREQLVLGAPDLAHAALAEELDELVAAQPLRLVEAAAQLVQDRRRHDRDDRAR